MASFNVTIKLQIETDEKDPDVLHNHLSEGLTDVLYDEFELIEDTTLVEIQVKEIDGQSK